MKTEAADLSGWKVKQLNFTSDDRMALMESMPSITIGVGNPMLRAQPRCKVELNRPLLWSTVSTNCDFGADVDILIRICSFLRNVTCYIIFRPHLDYGNLVNGTWTGLTGEILSGNITTSLLSKTAERNKVLQYSDWLKMHALFAVTRFPKASGDQFGSILVFNPMGWAIIMAAALLLATFFTVTMPRHRKKPIVYSWLDYLMEIGMNLIENNWMKTDFSKRNAIVFIWKLSPIFIIASYNSGILSELLTNIPKYPFRNYDGLVKCYKRKECQSMTFTKGAAAHLLSEDANLFPELAPAAMTRKAVFGSYLNTRNASPAENDGRTLVEYMMNLGVAQLLRQDAEQCKYLVTEIHPQATTAQFGFRKLNISEEEQRNIQLLIYDIDRTIPSTRAVGLIAAIEQKYEGLDNLLNAYQLCYRTQIDRAPLQLSQYIGMTIPMTVLLFAAFVVLSIEVFHGADKPLHSGFEQKAANKTTGCLSKRQDLERAICSKIKTQSLAQLKSILDSMEPQPQSFTIKF